MESQKLLCDSDVCRLCAEENANGTCLFGLEENGEDLSRLVNKYLPLKVEKDEKYPSRICPGCNIQLEATKQFLELIIIGQNKLRELFRVQQETLLRQEKQRVQLENALKNVNPTSSVQTYSIESDETGEKYIIQIFSEGPLFPPEHELSLRAEGLDRPKRKRGRPPKPPPPTEEELLKQKEEEELRLKQAEAEEQENEEVEGDGRRKRKIKVPSRFREAFKGKELDRLFKEEGVLEDDISEELKSVVALKDEDEVIGHLQTKEGEDLGELIILNKNSNRMLIKAKGGIAKKKKYECEICGREFLHLGRYEAHKSFHKNTNKYICCEPKCDFQADSKPLLDVHQIEKIHSGFTILEGPEVLNEGMENAEPQQENRILCEICSKTFSCKQNYEMHMTAVHQQLRPYECKKCDKTFPYHQTLKCHMLQHSAKMDKIYPCDICRKVFNHPSSLVYHREAEHNNGRRFVCNKCNKSFKHRQLLQRHQLVHSDRRPHPCSACDQSFKTRANLQNHMPVHTGEKKFYCEQCGQTFTHKTSLKLHTRWHSGYKPYECDVCQKAFSQKGNLVEHKRIHTGEKPYCCSLCGRKFTTSSQFNLHMKRHTGVKPWSCEYCSKTFLHKDTWRCHTRRHRNERPFQCKVCFRGFTEHWALTKHVRLHTGEKPYICDVCNKSFADCSNLTKHKNTHENKSSAGAIVKDAKVIKPDSQGIREQVVYMRYQEEGSKSPQVIQIEESDFDSAATSSGIVEYQQIVDNEGNPVSVTTDDGQVIKVVTSANDAQQHIQGLLPDGTVIPINFGVMDGKTTASTAISETRQADDTLVLPKETLIAPVPEPLLDNTLELLGEEGQKIDNNIQFLTDDVQGVCLVAPYNIEDTINSQYLAMS